jgi:photosystem II stability/assembly factor-like uncharacterized protein
MKKIAIILLASLCAVVLFGRSAAETEPAAPPGAWTAIGPFGGSITGLDRNPKAPSELFASSANYPAQIFRSGNAGASWTRQSIVQDRVYDLVADPKTAGTIYALCEYSLHVSKDKGKTFTRYSLPDGFSVYSGRLAVHPTNPKIILAGGYYRYDKVNWKSAMAVAKTTDGGAHWTVKQIGQNLDWGYTRDIAFAKSNPGYVYACGYDYDGGFHPAAFVSKNGGSTWVKVSGASAFQSATACYSLTIDPRDPKKAWVGHSHGVARTANAGASWQAQSGSQVTRVTALAADSANPNILYAGGNFNYVSSSLKSTDGGVTWKGVSKGLYGEPSRILATGAGVHQASAAGIFRSKNGGAAWSPSHAGIRATAIDALGISPAAPNTIYAGLYGYAVLKTTNGGGSWAPCAEFYGSNLVASIAVHPTNPNTLYVKPSG